MHFCRQHVVACPEGRCRDIVILEDFLLIAGDDSQCRLRMADLPAGQVVADDLFPVQVDDGPIVAAEAHSKGRVHPVLRNLEPGAEVGGDVFIFLVRSEPDPGRYVIIPIPQRCRSGIPFRIIKLNPAPFSTRVSATVIVFPFRAFQQVSRGGQCFIGFLRPCTCLDLLACLQRGCRFFR